MAAGLRCPHSFHPGQPGRPERLWKAMTAGRRLAIMIDDAPSASAVEASVPGQGPAPLVVTSRRMLGAGSPTGFRQLRLRPLKRPAAIGLLVRQLGQTETTRDTASLGDLARACSGLPLALRCAAWMITCPNNTDPGLTVQLAAEETRLAARGVPRSEARARALIEVTSQLLEPDVARAFRLLAFCPGPELSSELAVAMLDTSPAQTCALLGDLARAGLIERAGYGWWKFHDLAQVHAREQGGRIGTALERRPPQAGCSPGMSALRFPHMPRSSAASVQRSATGHGTSTVHRSSAQPAPLTGWTATSRP